MSKVIDKSEAVAKLKKKIRKRLVIEKYMINNHLHLTVLYSDWYIQQYNYSYVPNADEIEKIKDSCTKAIYKVVNSPVDEFPTATIIRW
jgi:hypothetical protein